MSKRIMLAVVGAGMGALAGLAVQVVVAGNPAVVLSVCAVIGALAPQFVLGQPGH